MCWGVGQGGLIRRCEIGSILETLLFSKLGCVAQRDSRWVLVCGLELKSRLGSDPGLGLVKLLGESFDSLQMLEEHR